MKLSQIKPQNFNVKYNPETNSFEGKPKDVADFSRARRPYTEHKEPRIPVGKFFRMENRASLKGN